jgi:hypothetical protein
LSYPRGAFGEDHEEQRFSEAEVIDDPWPHRVTCGLDTPYEADLIWERQLGSTLTAALQDPVEDCGGGDGRAALRVGTKASGGCARGPHMSVRYGSRYRSWTSS